jgi:hypothetical protein
MKIVDCGRFYHIHEQAEEEDCVKGGNAHY